jgi:hypothetical protein
MEDKLKELKNELDYIISKLTIITSNNNKDELITSNGTAISNIVMLMAEKLDSLEIQAMTINNKTDYIKKVIKIAEKTENSAQLKYLFKVIEIELS